MNQRIAAVKHYYKCNEQPTMAARRLAQEFDINPPQGRNIRLIVEKFEATGSVATAKKSGRPKTATNVAKAEEAIRRLEQSPQKSTRRLSAELEVSQSSVIRILHQKKWKPYIPRLLHALHDGDDDRRLQFCEEFLAKLHEEDTMLDNIWWSDEACFKLNGTINRHNCVYWAANNPRVTVEKEVNLPGVTVWAAISPFGIIGPFFFEGSVTAEIYLDMLQTFFWPRVQDQDCYFQHDGAPPHYGRYVRQWLDENFPRKWIGRRGPIEWPARSPDLTPPDFFLWGLMKDLVYREKPRTIQELKAQITAKFEEIDIELCRRVCRSVPARLQLCIDHEGGHFENCK